MMFTKLILVLSAILTSFSTNFVIISGFIGHDRESVTSKAVVIVPTPDKVAITSVSILASHTLFVSWSIYGVCKKKYNLVPITSILIVLWTVSFNIIRHHYVAISSQRVWFLSAINFLLVIMFFFYCLMARLFKKKRLHVSCYFVRTEEREEADIFKEKVGSENFSSTSNEKKDFRC